MFEPNALGQLMEIIGELNEAFFPAQIIGAIIALVLVYLCFVRPGPMSSNLMKFLLAVIHGINGYGTAMCAIRLGTAFYMFESILESAVTIILLLDIFLKKFEFRLPQRNDLKIWSIILIIWGVFMYPLTEILLGYRWPEIAVFGAICPTTIFTIGLAITALEKPDKSLSLKALILLLSIGAVIIGGRIAILGGLFDIAYFASGICGIVFLIKYRNKT